jgi:predicted nucleic acid-binding protein
MSRCSSRPFGIFACTLIYRADWVTYLGDGPQAEAFGSYLERADSQVVPTIVIYDVVKKLQLTSSSVIVQRFLSQAFRARVVELDANLAVTAAHFSIRYNRAMADAIIYATAESVSAQVITGDPDFRDLPAWLFSDSLPADIA